MVSLLLYISPAAEPWIADDDEMDADVPWTQLSVHPNGYFCGAQFSILLLYYIDEWNCIVGSAHASKALLLRRFAFNSLTPVTLNGSGGGLTLGSGAMRLAGGASYVHSFSIRLSGKWFHPRTKSNTSCWILLFSPNFSKLAKLIQNHSSLFSKHSLLLRRT